MESGRSVVESLVQVVEHDLQVAPVHDVTHRACRLSPCRTYMAGRFRKPILEDGRQLLNGLGRFRSHAFPELVLHGILHGLPQAAQFLHSQLRVFRQLGEFLVIAVDSLLHALERRLVDGH